MPRRHHHDLVPLVLGTTLLVAYVVQASFHLEWDWLVERQATDGWKLATGGVLVAYLWLQWRLRDRRGHPDGALWRHRIGGALAPLVLYAHASRFAYGYLVWLWAVYLGTVVAGLLHPIVLAARTRWLYTTWFIVHLAAATALVVLAGYHAVIALQYE